MAAKTIKMCDMHISIVLEVFQRINSERVTIKKDNNPYSVKRPVIVTDFEPKDLNYPEGWYYAKGCLRNKHTSSTGFYDEIKMVKSNGEKWKDSATYCTLYDC